MKLSLQLKLGQQLTMTPQLQQAIRLLQLSTLDLQQEIHEALESNPMLEMEEDGEDSNPVESSDQPNGNDEAAASSQNSEKSQSADSNDDNWQDQIPNDLSVDSNWDDVYPNSTSSASNSYDSDHIDYESRNSADETLQDHLMWQLNLTPMSETDEAIGMAIIDAIDALSLIHI